MMNDPMFRHFFGVPENAPQQKDKGLGTGFVIDADGYIITNVHVIENANKITIHFSDNSEYIATLVGYDKNW